MPPQDPNRRKSRIGPGLLRSIAVSGGPSQQQQQQQQQSQGPNDALNSLFSSMRQDQDSTLNPLRRSQHQYHHSSETNNDSGQEANQQQPHDPASFVHFQPLSVEIADPIDKLSVAVDQLVEKMAIVADIHAGLAYFNESFGSLLYGLKMNAANVDWAEAPTKLSFERQEKREIETAIFQQQQEELEQIRRQHILEQEQEQERQRLEVERQAEERLRAAMQQNNNINNSASSGNRQRRPVGASAKAKVMSGISRIPAARVKQPPSAMSGGASRVGQGGGVRKLAGRIVMKKVAEKLPLRYREEPHSGPIEAIMRSLGDNMEGQQLPDLVSVAGVARHKCNDYLQLLVQAKEIVRTNNKGIVYTLNPARYPSR
ncbi:hypothetical protein BGZ83_007308 [Gryganskiella cystojenkinii]|nr:hypothetical protein BGZ83_007308 [Gryganskiella cystojenkinii]